MPRARRTNTHLPRCMYQRRGAYYFVSDGRWLPLGRDWQKALVKYADLAGDGPKLGTIADAVTHYLEEAAPRLKAATMAGYKISAPRLIRVFGEMRLDELRPSHVYRYISDGANVAANRDKALLSAAYSYARRLGQFEGEDPTKRLQWRNPERPRRRYVEDAELDAILSKASPKLALIVRFAYLTGMRQSDVLGVKVEDLTAEGIRYEAQKNGARILVQWSDELRSVVHQARALGRRDAVWLFESRPKHRGKPNGPKGWTQYTASGVKAMWRRVKIKAGLADVTFHDLRRKAGSDVEADEAPRLLGHSDARVTQRHYRAKPQRVRPVR